MKCLDPTDNAPAAVAATHVKGHFRDADAISNFVRGEGVDVLTMEIEHINAEALEQAARESQLDVEPTPGTIKVGREGEGGAGGRERWGGRGLGEEVEEGGEGGRRQHSNFWLLLGQVGSGMKQPWIVVVRLGQFKRRRGPRKVQRRWIGTCAGAGRLASTHGGATGGGGSKIHSCRCLRAMSSTFQYP